MTLPNLAGVIKAVDVYTKSSDSYTASYVTWAKTAQLMHEHAPGWEFCLKPVAQTDELIHKAPNGTGYILCYFKGPHEAITGCFPYACMDRQNNPIPYDKISARVLTNSHRRGYCAACAFFFSLGYELWANEEIAGASSPSSVFQAGASAIAKATTMEDIKQLTERLTARHASGDLSQVEYDQLLQQLVDKEAEIDDQ